MRCRGVVFFLAVCLLAGSALATQIQLARVPASAQWVFHFDTDRFNVSKMKTLLTNDLNGAQSLPWMNTFQSRFGFDPIKDVKGVTVYGTKYDGNGGVVLIDLGFDAASLVAAWRTNPVYQAFTYETHTAFRSTATGSQTSEDGPRFLAAYGSRLLVAASSEADLKTAIDALDGKVPPLRESPYPALSGLQPGGIVLAAAGGYRQYSNAIPAITALQNTEGMALRASESETGENLNVSLSLMLKTAEEAAGLQQLVQGIMATMILGGNQDADVLSLLQNLEVSAAGSQVKLSLSYPSARLYQMIKKQQAKSHPPGP